MFGMVLRASPYLNGKGWKELEQLIINVTDPYQVLHQQMKVLVLKAKSIYVPRKKSRMKRVRRDG